MTLHQKLGFWGQIRFLRGKKVFWAPLKSKIDFLQKPELCDLTKSGLQLPNIMCKLRKILPWKPKRIKKKSEGTPTPLENIF